MCEKKVKMNIDYNDNINRKGIYLCYVAQYQFKILKIIFIQVKQLLEFEQLLE